MKNKLWIPLIAILLLTTLDGYSQRWRLQRYGAEVYIAAVHFHGDIGPAQSPFKDHFNGIRPSIGIKPSFMILPTLTVALDLGYVVYGGKDIENESHAGLSFNSHGFQHVARLEYYFLALGRSQVTGAIYNRQGMLNNYNVFNLFAFVGGGGVLTKSKVKYLDTGEEALDMPGVDNNLKYTPVFPLGVGFTLSIDPRWSIGAEIGYQFCLGDYVDGYSHPQYSKYNDSYWLTSVKAIYKIRNTREGRPIFRKLYR